MTTLSSSFLSASISDFIFKALTAIGVMLTSSLLALWESIFKTLLLCSKRLDLDLINLEIRLFIIRVLKCEVPRKRRKNSKNWFERGFNRYIFLFRRFCGWNSRCIFSFLIIIFYYHSIFLLMFWNFIFWNF